MAVWHSRLLVTLRTARAARGNLRRFDDELVFNLGGVYEIEKHHSLLFSLGRSFRASRSGEPELLGYIAIQFTY